MASVFKSGVRSIAGGVSEVTVSGLALTFTPTVVQVAVRQPASSADIISAVPVGTPTADGFSVVLSSVTARTDYVLEYVAFGDGSTPSPTDRDSLQVTYADLKKEVARFLGYDVANMTSAQTGEVDDYIQSGLRQFYYPPSDGARTHRWSFLNLSGTVTTASGTFAYALPDGFGDIVGVLTYADGFFLDTVRVVSAEKMRELRGRSPTLSGRPQFAAVVPQDAFGAAGQSRKLEVFPNPDGAYALGFSGTYDTGKIDAAHPFPLGGPMYGELVIESCLAIAEQKANDEMGTHTSKFNQMIASMTARDCMGGAQDYGNIGDQEGFRW